MLIVLKLRSREETERTIPTRFSLQLRPHLHKEILIPSPPPTVHSLGETGDLNRQRMLTGQA